MLRRRNHREPSPRPDVKRSRRDTSPSHSKENVFKTVFGTERPRHKHVRSSSKARKDHTTFRAASGHNSSKVKHARHQSLPLLPHNAMVARFSPPHLPGTLGSPCYSPRMLYASPMSPRSPYKEQRIVQFDLSPKRPKHVRHRSMPSPMITPTSPIPKSAMRRSSLPAPVLHSPVRRSSPMLAPYEQSAPLEKFFVGSWQGVALLDVQGRIPSPTMVLPQVSQGLFKIAFTGSTAKGCGMFASTQLLPGTRVLAEYPAVIVPAYLDAYVSGTTGLDAALSHHLPPVTHRDFMCLANSRPFERSMAEAIIQTNALPIELQLSGSVEVKPYRGVFLQASRCNHSCSPNAVFRWDQDCFSLYLEVVKPIQPGEEITISYIPLDRSHVERNDLLQTQYNFRCTCDACNASQYAITQGDDARARLRGFWGFFPGFVEWCTSPAYADDTLIRANLSALDLIEREGLHALGHERHLDLLAMCYGALANVDMFVFWIQRVRAIRAQRYPEAGAAIDRWIADPRTFHVWGWRARAHEAAKARNMFSSPGRLA
ncbi:hypothetical protein HGRIS_009479 [Hohenbuehelia grisea]|uniref:SET domain-containing protein n=1 Tax=Hohenbuehelia grisea TaxID=104357 RepID=A0ABR3J1N6_9AGAR